MKNMESSDKTFFSNLFNKIETHQVKTCDELKEVDKKVVSLQTSFKAHIDYTKNDENKKWKLFSGIMGIVVIIVMVAEITL